MGVVVRLRPARTANPAAHQRFLVAAVSKIDSSARWIKDKEAEYQVDAFLETGAHSSQVKDKYEVSIVLSTLRDDACKRGRVFSVFNHSGEPASTLGIELHELVF